MSVKVQASELQDSILRKLAEAKVLLQEAVIQTHEYNAVNNIPNYRTIDFVVPIGVAISNIEVAIKDVTDNGIVTE